jgi:hypothetical protein
LLVDVALRASFTRFMLTEADLPEDIDALCALVLEQFRMLADARTQIAAQQAELVAMKTEADVEIERPKRSSKPSCVTAFAPVPSRWTLINVSWGSKTSR